ncbi:MAG: 5-formyltetrahydrofolate cyclo-ligase [Brevinema sp.]
MSEIKEKLRRQVLKKRKSMDLLWRDHMEKNILVVMELLLPKQGAVAFYYPISQEISLRSLWHEAWRRDLSVLFPRVTNEHEMILLPVTCDDDFEQGTFGILEPKITTKIIEKIDVIFVPGLIFGRDGSRIGYGKGYYDRLLQHYPKSKKIGVVWDELLVDTLPMQIHDVFMDLLLTEKQLLFMK